MKTKTLADFEICIIVPLIKLQAEKIRKIHKKIHASESRFYWRLSINMKSKKEVTKNEVSHYRFLQ